MEKLLGWKEGVESGMAQATNPCQSGDAGGFWELPANQKEPKGWPRLHMTPSGLCTAAKVQDAQTTLCASLHERHLH